MSVNYSKLIGRIIEKFGTRRAFAEKMEISERSLSLKLNGRVPWTQMEIHRACMLLDIPISKMHIYFFDLEVQVS